MNGAATATELPTFRAVWRDIECFPSKYIILFSVRYIALYLKNHNVTA